jgi:hypothetical protein
MRHLRLTVVAAVLWLAAVLPVSAAALPNCKTDTNYAAGTKFVACCPLISNDCSSCCGVDAAHPGSCPERKPRKLACDPSDGVAGTASAPKVIEVPNALGTPYLQVVIGNFARVLVGISGSLALLIFVWAGITMMRANGDAKLIQKAKDMMVWTAIGLLIIFGSEAIVRSVLSALFTGSAA